MSHSSVEGPLQAISDLDVECFFGEAMVLDLSSRPQGGPLTPEHFQRTVTSSGDVYRLILFRLGTTRRRVALSLDRGAAMARLLGHQTVRYRHPRRPTSAQLRPALHKWHPTDRIARQFRFVATTSHLHIRPTLDGYSDRRHSIAYTIL